MRVGVSFFFAIIMGTGVSAEWQNWILFSNSTTFGIKDPQFHKDIGFYVFRLPFLQFAAGWTFAALLVVLIVTSVFHYLNGGIRLQSPFQRVTPQVKVHLSVLLALMALTKTVQYYLAQFALTLSHRGFVDGATYTDVHAQLPALRLADADLDRAAAILFIVEHLAPGLGVPDHRGRSVGVHLDRRRHDLPGGDPALHRAAERALARSSPTSSATSKRRRTAFDLDSEHLTTKSFQYDAEARCRATSTTTATPCRTSGSTTRRRSGRRSRSRRRSTTFYEFTDVDVDRYKIGDENDEADARRRCASSTSTHLPDNSWTSQHLVYTHGYGAVAAAADEVNNDQPSYVLSRTSRRRAIAASSTASTGVYFGEDAGGYSVVDTKVAGAGGAATRRQHRDDEVHRQGGRAGLELPAQGGARAALRRLEPVRLGSGHERSRASSTSATFASACKTVAPFLKFDADPYPVVLDGRIVWVLDAYTTTNNYPYSQSIHPHDLPRAAGSTPISTTCATR